MWPVDSLRTDFVCRNGTATTIMDYARFNYVAQPGDQTCFHPKIGPYDLYAVEWAYIPHFYYNFYVYQYATAYSAAVALSRKVLAGGESDREQYLDILRSGCSRYPVETIRLGGVDMTTSRPMEDVIALFGSPVSRHREVNDRRKSPEAGSWKAGATEISVSPPWVSPPA